MHPKVLHGELDLELEAVDAISKYSTHGDAATSLNEFRERLNSQVVSLSALRQPVSWKTGSAPWISIPCEQRVTLSIAQRWIEVEDGDTLHVEADWLIHRSPVALRGNQVAWTVLKSATKVTVVRSGSPADEVEVPMMAPVGLGWLPTPIMPLTVAALVGQITAQVFDAQYRAAVSEAGSLLASWDEMHKERYVRASEWLARRIRTHRPMEALRAAPPLDLYTQPRFSKTRPAGLGR